MATIVCQGLQTCLESHPLNEPRKLKLTLASPKPSLSQPNELTSKSLSFLDSNNKEAEEKCKNNISHENKQVNTNPGKGGWSFLQDLCISSKDAKEDEKAYVHPSMRKCSQKLSEKSLEMCTENLGNETGTNITESNILSSSLNSTNYADFPMRKELKSRSLSGTKKVSPCDFPPPLTTLAGSESLGVRCQREDGRLVIIAVKSQSSRTCFHAERTDGRLRLSIVGDYCPSDYESEEMIDENEEYDEDESDEEYCFREAAECSKDMDVEAEVGMEKFLRLSRCKERRCGNKRFLNWEPFCVATS